MDKNLEARARQAAELKDSAAYQGIVADIMENARVLFFSANSGIEELTKAQAMVRAVETFEAAMKSRMDELVFEQHKKGKAP